MASIRVLSAICVIIVFMSAECSTEKRLFFGLIDSLGATTIKGCNTSYADIAFLLDTSGSETVGDIQLGKDFIANFVSKLDVGPHQAHVSVVSFASLSYIHFYLNDYTDTADIISGIEKINFRGGSTMTGNALHVVRDYVFTKEHGDRRSAPNILIVLTDGNSQYHYDTFLAAKNLRDNGVKIFAIGVGRGISEQELLNIGGNREHVFHVSSYSFLSSIQQTLQTLSCDALHGIDCTDKIKNCGQYNHACSSDMYHVWAEENCPHYCGYCNPAPRPSTPSSQYHGSTFKSIVYTQMSTVAVHSTKAPESKPQPTYKTTNHSSSKSSPIPTLQQTAKTTNTASTKALWTTTGPTPTPLYTVPCKNFNNNCAAYGTNVCKSYREWSVRYCPQFCQFCEVPTTPTTATTPTTTLPTTTKPLPAYTKCEDHFGSCPQYGREMCTRFHDWAAVRCSKFCGFCDEKDFTTTPTTAFTTSTATPSTATLTTTTQTTTSTTAAPVTTTTTPTTTATLKPTTPAKTKMSTSITMKSTTSTTSSTTTLSPTIPTSTTTTLPSTITISATSSTMPTTTAPPTTTMTSTTSTTTPVPTTTTRATTKVPHTNPVVIVIGRRGREKNRR